MHVAEALSQNANSENLSDPYSFRLPVSRSGSISQRYGSGSRSFDYHAKIVRKTWIPTVL
jgi:hypothetical protein